MSNNIAAIMVLDVALPARWRAFLCAEAARLQTPGLTPRPWHWQGLHNPWSRAASLFDAWGFLDLCADEAMLTPVRRVIGPDVVLFDSFWLPDPWGQMGARPADDPVFFPVTPCAGVTVCCAWDGMDEKGPKLFAARYFPASSRYLREPGHPAHLALMERLPLVNAVAAPLWLVAGADRAGNDFVTGFNPPAPFWSETPVF